MFKKKARIEDDFISYGSGREETQASEGGNLLSKLIQFLIVIVLMGIVGFMGFFGYRYMQKEGVGVATQPVAQGDASNAKAESAASQPQAAAEVARAPKQKMYTQEEMQAIVKMLMEQMQNKEHKNESAVTDAQKREHQDESAEAPIEATDDLVAALDIAEVDEVDEVTPDLPGDLKDLERIQAKAAGKSAKKVDHYNKVVVKKSANSYDDLANLSDQIGDIVETMNKKKAQSSYTSSIEKEVSARVAEMRVVVVQPGDTLSKIAKRVYGHALDYDRIFKANPELIKNPNNIYIGQRLRVPMN